VSTFTHTRDGVVVGFDEVEASLLRHLVREVRDLLDEGQGRPSEPPESTADLPDAAALAAMTGLDGPDPTRPDDPVLARLLPDGYRDDEEAAGEFRRFTESSLRQEKWQAATAMLADLPGDGGNEVRLDTETVARWLTALNDVRLALGTRLDVAEEMPEPDPDDPDAPAYVVYLWLTELQDVLVQVAAEATP
jgi:hypothetical protein